MKEPISETVERDKWCILLDPSWRSNQPPPVDAIVGGWMLEEDNTLGPFQPNPHYLPGDEATPTDPVDATLRLIAEGTDRGDQLVPTVRNTVVEIGCDEQNQLLIAAVPDGTPCALVVTAEVHKRRVRADRWWPVLGSMLPEVVPPGLDILLNPGDPAQFRLPTQTLSSNRPDPCDDQPIGGAS